MRSLRGSPSAMSPLPSAYRLRAMVSTRRNGILRDIGREMPWRITSRRLVRLYTVARALAHATSNERFAWDCYRRFIQMYGDVVMGVQKAPHEDHEPFEDVYRYAAPAWLEVS